MIPNPNVNLRVQRYHYLLAQGYTPEQIHEMMRADEQRWQQETEKRRQEGEARQRVEAERRETVQRQRQAQGQCVLCGQPLALLAKLLRRIKHRGCSSYQE